MLVLTSTGQKNIMQENGNQTSLVTNILQNVFFYVMFQGRKKKVKQVWNDNEGE